MSMKELKTLCKKANSKRGSSKPAAPDGQEKPAHVTPKKRRPETTTESPPKTKGPRRVAKELEDAAQLCESWMAL